jgi:hypothetical protein
MRMFGRQHQNTGAQAKEPNPDKPEPKQKTKSIPRKAAEAQRKTENRN